MIKKIKQNWLSILLITLFYFIVSLPALTKLPVFADESIYIRWSQLIIDNWQRFLFFSMNDGKTPLFIWSMIPFQFVFKDQLFAARFTSLLVGLLQVFVNIKIIKILGAKKRAQFLIIILSTILPFWYFHHRMALMDGMLTLFISLTFLMLSRMFKQHRISETKNLLADVFAKKTIKLIFLAGIYFFLALLTKIPAVVFIPAFYLTIFLNKVTNFRVFIVDLTKVSLSIIIAFLLFLILKINPIFGQLFSRGSDFLFPVSEIISGEWKQTIFNFPTYANYFVAYLTPGTIILVLMGLFSKKYKKIIHVLFWSGLFFILPIAIMGKTVYPRYLFPASLFFTLAAALELDSLITISLKHAISLKNKVVVSLVISLLIANIISSSFAYIEPSIIDFNNTPFVSADTTQYLTEWSSGHGIKEVVKLIEKESASNTIAVATEGYFGTLPDGILMYFHGRNVDNIYIEGIGQPVQKIPKSFALKARQFDKKWLVVNSHRLSLKLDKKNLIAEYCRPFNAPCLQVFDITDNFNQFVK